MSRVNRFIVAFVVVYIISSIAFFSILEQHREELLQGGYYEDATGQLFVFGDERQIVLLKKADDFRTWRGKQQQRRKQPVHITRKPEPYHLNRYLKKKIREKPKNRNIKDQVQNFGVNEKDIVNMNNTIYYCAGNTSTDKRAVKSNVCKQVDEGVYVYSAFYDARGPNPHIRIIAAIQAKLVRRKTIDLWCHFENINEDESWSDGVTNLHLYQMCENHRKPLGGWILSCPVPRKYFTEGRQPRSVNVSTQPGRDIRGARISIMTTERSRGKQIDFAVCVPPLFGKTRSEDLVQFVELSRILGASHFVFYVYSVNPQVKSVLKYYQSRGIATVLQWALPTISSSNIWYYGQLLAINDCLYRNMAQVEYLIFNDLDEFLVPHGAGMQTWRDVVRENHNRNKTCGMTFKSAFFDVAFREDRNYSLHNVSSLDITTRTREYSDVRNKVMIEPYKIFEIGIHHVSRPWPDSADYKVFETPTDLAYLHHYRHCSDGYRMNCEDGINDTTLVVKYGNAFYTQYLRVMRDIGH